MKSVVAIVRCSFMKLLTDTAFAFMMEICHIAEMCAMTGVQQKTLISTMANKKKIAEMNPQELVDHFLKGKSNEFAEQCAIIILSQIVAKQLYVNHNENAFDDVLKKILDGTVKFKNEHSWELALVSAFITK